MKSRTLICTAAMTLLAALAIQVQLAAQEQAQQEHKKHSRYKVIDLVRLAGLTATCKKSSK